MIDYDGETIPVAISAQTVRDTRAALRLAKETLDAAMLDLAIAWPIARAALAWAERNDYTFGSCAALSRAVDALTPEQRARLRGTA